tara:strand:+ start:121 stop:318 length:198 start_codon:yes stop_codon:yes gene_type:complete
MKTISLLLFFLGSVSIPSAKYAPKKAFGWPERNYIKAIEIGDIDLDGLPEMVYTLEHKVSIGIKI